MATVRQIEGSLKELNELKAALDEHAIVAITDAQGKITCVNEKFCSISKYAREELLGQDHRVINSGFHSKEYIRDLWTTIARGQVWRGEIKNKAKDGSFYWVDTTIVPFLNEQGKPRQYIAIRAEITARKNAEAEVRKLNAELEARVVSRTAELETTNKELEAFSYSVSHDLRAPLRAINGFSEILLSEYASDLTDEARHYLERIRNGGVRMASLVDELLKFTQLNRHSLQRLKINMTDMVQEVVNELKQGNSRSVDTSIGHLPDCDGDPVLVKQVWMNLFSNAFKYTRNRDHAVVEVGCQQKNGAYIYFVRDNGVGFDMKYAQRIFCVFQRLHTVEEFEGSGVGLAIVQRVVHRHGGRVWFDAAPDRGATFYFTLNGE